MVLVESGLYIFRDMEQGFQKYYPGLTLMDRNGTFTIHQINYDVSTITLTDTKSKEILFNCSYEEFSRYFKIVLDYREVRVPNSQEKWYLLYHMDDIFVVADTNKGWDSPSTYIRKNATPDPILVKMTHNDST